MTDFLALAHARYSVREFTDAPVEREKIDAILEAALVAPSAVNKQPWHAWVLTAADDLAAAGATTRYDFHAKTVIVVGADPEAAWTRRYDGENFAVVDASIVGTHIMLEAHDLGLGSTWVASFDQAAMKKAFPQMDGYDLIAMFPIGYPSPSYEPAPMHAMSKPLDEMVDWI